uniref:DDE-1 domain-containing protein n=1 Tax=Ditylenchus dipsaci TaxID=166011 RepID=A0A915DL27_9BILA
MQAVGRLVEERGAKEHDTSKDHCDADSKKRWQKMKPLVLLPRVRPDKSIVKQFGQQLFLVWAGKIWMDDSRTAEFLNRVMVSRLFEKDFSFRMPSDVTPAKPRRRFYMISIFTQLSSGGCTKFIQAPDVCWNSPFKAHIRSYYETWISNGDRMTFTSGGNPRAPSMEVYLDWILRAWEALSKNLIINSFKVCGLTNASDGSEDDFIHCFKAHGPIPEGLEMLKEEGAKETAVEVSEEEDVKKT